LCLVGCSVFFCGCVWCVLLGLLFWCVGLGFFFLWGCFVRVVFFFLGFSFLVMYPFFFLFFLFFFFFFFCSLRKGEFVDRQSTTCHITYQMLQKDCPSRQKGRRPRFAQNPRKSGSQRDNKSFCESRRGTTKTKIKHNPIIQNPKPNPMAGEPRRQKGHSSERGMSKSKKARSSSKKNWLIAGQSRR